LQGHYLSGTEVFFQTPVKEKHMGMIIHAGGRVVDLPEVQRVVTPANTRTHFPIPHDRLLTEVESALDEQGYEVEKGEYALRNGKLFGQTIIAAQFFALLALRHKSEPHNPEYRLIAGLRNAHDMVSAAMFALGSSVFICDNMALSGEVKIGRKHTRFILRDLPALVRNAMRNLPAMKANQDLRIGQYKETGVSDNWARCAIMTAAENDLISWSKTGKVWKEWKSPRHDAFQPRNAWSLFNGFTEVLKEYNVQDLPRRSLGLHKHFDKACKVELN